MEKVVLSKSIVNENRQNKQWHRKLEFAGTNKRR